MEQDPETPRKPVIPPPDLSMPPPPPVLPSRGTSSPAPAMPSGAADSVRVNLRNSSDEAESSATGLAPFNTRAIAAIIDSVVSLGLMVAIIWLLPVFAGKIGWLAGIGYLITRDSLPFLGGQSVGKKAMNIKVVTLEDKSLVGNWEVAAIRNGVLLIPFFAFIELYILLTREDKPERGFRLGDEWAKTKVIMAPRPTTEEKVE